MASYNRAASLPTTTENHLDDFFKDLKPVKREDSEPQVPNQAGHAEPPAQDKLVVQESHLPAEREKPPVSDSPSRPPKGDQFFHDLKPGRKDPEPESGQGAGVVEGSSMAQTGIPGGTPSGPDAGIVDPQVQDNSSYGDDSDEDDSEPIPIVLSQCLSLKDWKGFFRHFGSVTRSVLISPKQFFDHMPVTGGMKEPIIYLVTAALINSLLTAVIRLSPLSFFSSFFVSILSVAVGAVAAQFAFEKLGGKGSMEATVRVFVYSRATLIFAWLWLGSIPFGGMLAGLYSIYLNVFGIQKVHQLDDRKTVAMILAVLAAIGFALKCRTGI